MGLPDYLGGSGMKANSIVCVPGFAGATGQFYGDVLYTLHGAAAPPRFHWMMRFVHLALGNTVHEGCGSGGFYEQAQFADE